MKTITLSLLFTLLYASLLAQAPLGFNYQGIARDNKGKELTSKNISIQISILLSSATGVSVYTETHSITTNSFGLFSIKVGSGKMVSGNFSKINWSTGVFFLKVEMDPNGGSSYTFLGTSQLISVPYSMLSNLALKSLNDLDTSSVNELQILKFNNDTLYLDRGGYVYLGNYNDKNAVQQIKTKLNADSLYYEAKIKSSENKRISDSTYLKGLYNTNSVNIGNESNNRVAGDNLIILKQKADSTYLRNMLNTTTTNLNTESNSRIAGDNNLKIKIITDSTYLKGLITTEIANRTNADNTLQNNIISVKNKEISDSSVFASYLNSTITNLTNESNARISGDNSLKTKIIADSNFLKGLINTTNTNLVTETTNRINGDNTLKSKAFSDSTYLKGQINTTTTNLNTEITNRTNADNTLQTNINALKTKVVADSNYLKGLINTTNTNISTETVNRINGDNTIKSKAVSDSTYLRGQINTTNTNLNSEITNRTNADNTLQTNINTLKTKVVADSTYLKGLINTTNTNLATETINRIAGDNTIKIKAVSDSSYLKGQINNTITTLTTETNIRTTNDNNLKSKEISDSSFLKGLINTETINRNKADFIHYVGELYGGGIVVSVWKESGIEKGLIASLTDISTSSKFGLPSSNTASALSLTDGRFNTDAMISVYSSGAGNICANYKNPNYGTGVYSDWYLPSIFELGLCYNSFFYVNNILGSTNGFYEGYYWSSTEATSLIISTYQYFFNGEKTEGSKDMLCRVRAVRRFASNSISDIENNAYDTVIIGTQVWMKQNLKTTKYSNGDTIPSITNNTTWSGLSTGAYCSYNNESKNNYSYGLLYNWYAVNDSRKLCPNGWHIPSDAEWTILENYLITNGYNYDGTTTGNKYAKALASTYSWATNSNIGAVGNEDYPTKRNITGFKALPGGYRGYDGTFNQLNYGSAWWSKTEYTTNFSYYRSMSYMDNYVLSSNINKKSGLYIRCLKD